MTTYRGLDGFLCLGGKLEGSPILQASVASGLTTLGITGGASTLTGIVAVGDTFTVEDEPGGTTHTVTGSFYAMTNNAHTAITFTPEVTGAGIIGGKDVTFDSNAAGEVKLFNFTAEVEVIADTAMGDKFRTVKGGVASWSGTGEMHLDYDDTQQAVLIDSIANATPAPSQDAILFGTADEKLWYAQCLLSDFAITQTMGDIVSVTFNFTGTGSLRPRWD